MSLKKKYINPLTDFGFKKLFGTEINKDLLIDFLNQLLPQHHQIKQLTYTKNEHLGSSLLDRKAIFDLYCVSENGEKFIVEMQKAKQNFFKDRSVYYSAFAIREQGKKGEWNYRLTPVYTIAILDFMFTEEIKKDDLLLNVKLKDQNNNIFYDKLTYIYVQLPKFTKKEKELNDRFEKWMYVLRHLAKLQDRPIALQERIFKKLFEAAELAKFTPKERQQYEDSLKYYRDIKNVVDTARDEGIEEGIEIGIEEGIEIGIEKGAIKTVKRGLKEGASVEFLAKITGLSEDFIQTLKPE